MNLLLAIVLVALAKAGILIHCKALPTCCSFVYRRAFLSLLLCFFNLIPIPPLDGSKVLRVVTGMSWGGLCAVFASFGIFAVIIVMQIPPVRQAVVAVVGN